MSTAAPNGTCSRCGGITYEYLVHHCPTAVTPLEWQSSGETPESAHACNCVGCCRSCGSCVTWHGHTPKYCALLVRQATERAAFGVSAGETT